MKNFVAVVGLALAFLALPAGAQQRPDDQYISIYNLIQQADALAGTGQTNLALDSYQQALKALQQFQKTSPDWDPKIVNFRLNYLAQKISDLTAAPSANMEAGPLTNLTAGSRAPATNAVPSSPAPATNIQMNILRVQVEGLQAENKLLQDKIEEALRLQPATVDTPALDKAQARELSLMKQNALLLASLDTETNHAAAADESSKLRKSLADAEKKLARQTARAEKLAAANQTLQSNAVVNALAKAALEERLKQQQVASSATRNEVKTLRARLAVDEARPVPYTPEELALMKKPSAPAPPARAAGGKSPADKLPAGSAPLVAEARNYFTAGEYGKADADYRRILQEDPSNALVLANLAAIELQENKLADAETNITAALARNPDDAFTLSTYGILKFRQKQFDAALNALSRAAQLAPNDPKIQNYLGVTLSNKGLQAQAETALRKAVELAPNYAAAQNNLAVLYLSEKPPMPALARWHYQKALQLGQPPNPGLERKLADLGAPVSQ